MLSGKNQLRMKKQPGVTFVCSCKGGWNSDGAVVQSYPVGLVTTQIPATSPKRAVSVLDEAEECTF